MRFVLILIVILASHSLPGVRPLLGQQRDSVRELWLIRSQAITEEILKDAGSLEKWDQPILLARLSQLWWQENPEKGKVWLSKAIEIVEAVPNKENTTERHERLSTARYIFKLVASLDQRLSTRLMEVLRANADRLSDDERRDNSDVLVAAAVALAEKEPKRAADMGRFALRVGQPNDFDDLLAVLRRIDPKLSDGLFVEALSVARETNSTVLMYSLTRAAFPDQTYPQLKRIPPPENLRVAQLQLNLSWLRSNPVNSENRNAACTGVLGLILPVIAEFDRLLPQQAATAHQAISQCQGISPLAQQLIDDKLREQPLKTIDDLLKAAAEADDVKVRTVFHYRAAALAQQEKDFDRAIKILEGMNKEEREFMGEAWVSYRWHWPALAAKEAWTRGDLYAANVMIDGVPENLRVFTRIFLLKELPADLYKEKDSTLTVLNDAITGVRKSSVSAADKFAWYFPLLELVLKFQPADGASFLKEAIATLNRAEKTREEKNATPGPFDKFNILEGPKLLPASVTAIDEYAVKDALSSITSVTIRARLRLELLEATLKEMKQ